MSTEENIRVAVRIRPFSELHQQTQTCISYDTANGYVEVATNDEPRKYDFNAVFGEDSKQEFIFAKLCEPIVNSFLDGINGTIFAYGQTGSGKTHTMIGPEVGDGSFNHENKGIIPRVLEYLFASLTDEVRKQSNTFKYSLRCCFTELYNERFYDLLGDADTQLQLRANNIDAVQLTKVKEVELTCVSDGMDLLKQGWLQRKVAETAMNRESSRSHAIFMLVLETIHEDGAFTNKKISRLNLVDLAGSERQAYTKTTNNDRLREAGNINKSLSILARVIRSLANKKENEYIAYRDSMLTLLLRDSLGGNSKTAVVVNVHPNVQFIGDTLSTLNFAQNVKKVKNKATVNENISCNSVDALKAEVLRLKEELQNAMCQQPIQSIIDNEEVERLTQELQNYKKMTEEYRKLYNTSEKKLDTLKNHRNMYANTVKFLSEQRGYGPDEVKEFIERLSNTEMKVESINVDGRCENDRERLELDKMKRELDELTEKYRILEQKNERLEKENGELSSKLSDFMCRTQKKLKAPKPTIVNELVSFDDDDNTLPVITDNQRKLRRQTQFSVGSARSSKLFDDESTKRTTRSESVDKLKVKIADLEERIQDEERNRLEVDMELQQMRQVLSDKEALIAELQSSETKKIDELFNEISDWKSKTATAEIELKNALENCNRWCNEATRLKERVLEADDVITRQESKQFRNAETIAFLEKKLHDADELLNTLQDERELLENQLAISFMPSTDNETHEKQIQELRIQLKTAENEALEKCTKLIEENQELKIQMKIIEKQKDDALSENAKLNGHQNHHQKIQYLEKLKSELSNAQKENATLKAKVKRLENAKGKENKPVH